MMSAGRETGLCRHQGASVVLPRPVPPARSPAPARDRDRRRSADLAAVARLAGVSTDCGFFVSRVHSNGFSRFLASSSSRRERARGKVRHARPLARARARLRFAEVADLAAVVRHAGVSSERGFFDSRVHSDGFSRFLASSSSRRERARGKVRHARPITRPRASGRSARIADLAARRPAPDPMSNVMFRHFVSR